MKKIKIQLTKPSIVEGVSRDAGWIGVLHYRIANMLISIGKAKSLETQIDEEMLSKEIILEKDEDIAKLNDALLHSGKRIQQLEEIDEINAKAIKKISDTYNNMLGDLKSAKSLAQYRAIYKQYSNDKFE